MSGYSMIVVPPMESNADWQVVYGNLVHPGTVLAEVPSAREADEICVKLAMSFRVKARTFWPYEPKKEK